MVRRIPLRAGVLAAGLAAALLAAPAARAHGGRYRGPPGGVQPPDAGMPAPPAPKRGKPPTTPGAGIPTAADIHWATWWGLNRWAYYPERGEIQRRRRAAAVTTGPRSGGPTPMELTEARRAHLARSLIKPFLLEMLDPARGERDTVTAAAMLALAKVHADEAVLELLLKKAENAKATDLEREAAALAVGLLRRTKADQRLDAISLDLARGRLLALVDDDEAPIRARAFAAFSLGLLADQPYGSPFSKGGRMVVKGLVRLLGRTYRHPDLPIALLTALSLHPGTSVPTQVHQDLRRIVAGVPVYKRQWTPIERSHALSTLARLESPGWFLLVMRALVDRRLSRPVQRAARIALGVKATRLSGEERLRAAQGLLRSDKRAPDSLSEGLGHIALARVLRADLDAGSRAVFDETAATRVLLEGAAKGKIPVRGFNVLALALSVRGLRVADPEVGKYVVGVRKALLAGFDRPRGDNDLRSAYVIALGLVEAHEARDRLLTLLQERNAGPALRARVAIALAQVGAGDAETLAVLREVMADTRPLAPRGAAALALALITGAPDSRPLVEDLRAADSQRRQVSAAAALGLLDDPAALPALIAMAREKKHAFEVRALAIAITGLLGDAEDRPSLFRLTLDANYIAGSDALQEAFSLL